MPDGNPRFYAVNAIDGKTENTNHLSQPSWGPYKVNDAWLKVEFGKEVEIDKINIYLRADFPHDSHWGSGVIRFSDGTSRKLNFEKTGKKQVFKFKMKTVSWFKIEQLKQKGKLGWAGISEVEAWGKDVKH